MSKKQILLTLSSLVLLFSINILHGQDKFQVPLVEKTFNGKTVKMIDASKLADGDYSIDLSTTKAVNFQVLDKKITDQKVVNVAVSSQGYSCSGNICNCKINTNSAACVNMINKEKCDQLIEIGGILYGVKKQTTSGTESGSISFKTSATVAKRVYPGGGR
jgi:hypothetical protein